MLKLKITTTSIWNVQPNPALNGYVEIIIEDEQPATIVIRNLLGKTLVSYNKAAGERYIKLNIPKGDNIILVSMCAEKYCFTKKIISK